MIQNLKQITTMAEFAEWMAARRGDSVTVVPGQTWTHERAEVELQCGDCLCRWTTTPRAATARYRRSDCPNCHPPRELTQDQFVGIVERRHGGEIEVVGHWRGWASAVALRHVVCGHVWSVRADGARDVLRGRGCPMCAAGLAEEEPQPVGDVWRPEREAPLLSDGWRL